MDTAVIKFDTLADSVRAAAQDHNLLFVCVYRIFIRCVVGGVIISVVFRTAYVNPFPSLFHTQFDAMAADILFRDLQ